MAQRATSLGAKPSLFIISCFFCLVVSFPFFAFYTQKPCFPLDKGIFCLFLSVSLCFALAFFGLPLSQLFFLFLCLSLSLSLSLLFLSFFLPSCLCFCFLLVPCFCLVLPFYLFFAFVSWKEQHQNIKLQSFSSSIVSLFLVSCLVISFKSLSYLCFFLILIYVFVQHQCFGFKKKQVEQHQFLVKRGVATKLPFMNLCFAKSESYLFFLPFFGKFWLMFKKTMK